MDPPGQIYWRCSHETAATQIVPENGATQYIAKITAANTCRAWAPAANSAMTERKSAVGVQVTIMATAAVVSSVSSGAEPNEVLRMAA